MPLHIPGLAKKLQCLYQHNPRINSHELLARNLGIAPNNISVWINGSDVRVPELVPNRHVKTLSDLFGVPLELLELESLEEFKSRLRAVAPAGFHKWTRVLEHAVNSGAIRLIRCGAAAERQLRGLVADDTETAEQFALGERIYIHLSLDEAWRDLSRELPVSLIVLSIDAARTTCLCPSALAPDPCLNAPTLRIPHTAPSRGLKVSGPPGLQSVLVLLTRRSLPADVVAGLREGSTAPTLERFAEQLLAAPGANWRLLRKDYEVV
jgi:hypothetical protein